MVFSRWIYVFIAISLGVSASIAHGQDSRLTSGAFVERSDKEFRDPSSGMSSSDLVQRALASNSDLVASRLDVERARSRLRQSQLRPNPSVDVSQTTGRWTGSPEEKEFSVGLSVPVELGGKRGKRIDLAEADLAAAEAEVADRERLLAAEVRAAFAEAVTALRELEITSELNDLDRQTVQFVQARVNEGDAPPLELSLLRADADRLRSRRNLTQGRLESAILRLKRLTGIQTGDPLRFREDLSTVPVIEPPTLNVALETALAMRPDLRFARLSEQVAEAGLNLARAQAVPDITLSTRYSRGTTLFDETPVGILRDRDKALSFGATISLPILNRNQGAKAEAQTSILQAQHRREFIESLVRFEVNSAYSRYQAAQSAVAIYESGIISRAEENIRSVRGAYEIGAFRITDLLNEQRRLVDFQREYTDALAERYRALADINAAIGMPVN